MRIRMFILLCIFFVAACSNTTSNDTEIVELAGESENWVVIYTMEHKRTVDGLETKYLIELNFKNIQNHDLEEVEYTFESNAGHLKGKGDVNPDGLLIIDGSRTLNAAIPDNINVTLLWNDKSESLILSK